MVGNSTQDLGQLGGVAGTAGVAIGQLGEYAAEGGISLAGLASVAGPMAGLALVTEAVSAAMQIFADRAKQSKEDTAAWVAAIGEGGDAADNMARHLADAGQILADTSDHAVSLAKTAKVAGEELFSFGGVAKDTFKLLTGGFKPVKDITELLGEAGITVQQYTDALTGGAVGAEKFKDALAATNLSADDQSKLVNALANGQKDYASAAENSAAATKVFGDTSKDAADAQQELQNRLSDARDDWEAQKQAISDAADATAAYNDAVNSMEWKTAGLAGATKGLSEFADAQFGLTDAIIGIEAASDDFAKSLTDTQTNMKKTRFQFDLSTDAGRKNQKAMEDLARSIDVQVAPAFADSHGDFASFMKDADKITNQSLAELTKQFNLTAPQVEELKKQLGLTAGDWEAKFKLSGDEEARVKLGLIQGALTGLDKDTQLKIGAQITAGDLQGAVATAQAAFNDPNNQVNMPIKPQPPSPQELSDAVDLMQRDISKTPLVVPVIPSTLIPLKGRFDAGGTAGGEGGIAGERGPEILNDRYLVTGPTYIPPGTRVTSRKRTEQILRTNGVRGLKRYDAGGVVPRSTNVTINAAVIGSTFDVMYAVKDAVKRADRLLPRNP
jgi:hypothetical protein